jgi:N-acyl homoserine lactone hydrolase
LPSLRIRRPSPRWRHPVRHGSWGWEHLIDDLYHPNVISIDRALAAIGVDERDVVAVINSHLHFDHCGQNEVFHRRGVPIYVQAAEVETARTNLGYTVPEWAHVPDDSLRTVRGDERLLPGVTIIETPGHTPGHQSLVVETADGPVIIAGQCAYQIDEVGQQRVASDNMHDDTFLDAGQQSLERLLSMHPRHVVAAHDVRPWRAAEHSTLAP